MNSRSTIIREDRGAGAMEFALAAPVLFTIMIGATQAGTMFFANAGVQHAVAEGARVAAIFPMPSDAAIRAAITSQDFGLNSGQMIGEPSVTHRTDDNGNAVVDISMSYRVPLDFVFFSSDPVTITHSRTVFVQTGTESFGGGTPTPTPSPSPSPSPSPDDDCAKKNGKCK